MRDGSSVWSRLPVDHVEVIYEAPASDIEIVGIAY
jgi:hypothetical protein